MSPQAVRILRRLREGDATNYDLARIALKYTSRISDLREAGYWVDCVKRDRSTGVATYRLMRDLPDEPVET